MRRRFRRHPRRWLPQPLRIALHHAVAALVASVLLLVIVGMIAPGRVAHPVRFISTAAMIWLVATVVFKRELQFAGKQFWPPGGCARCGYVWLMRR